MKDLSALQNVALFVEVARTRSFSRAAENLGLSTATLSRRIRALERESGISLFTRTTRRVELTEAARRYFERCERLVDEAFSAQEALFEEAKRPQGTLRLSMPVDLGVHYIAPLLPEFARRYPGIDFEIDLSPQHRDLASEQIDIAIRLGVVKDQNLVSRRIGWIEQGLFASPTYLQRQPAPSHPEQLSDHDCIIIGAQAQAVWRLQRANETVEVAVKGRFAVNNVSLMRVLAERGFGVASLATVLARDALAEARLIPILTDWTVPRLPVQAVTSSRLPTACAKAFISYLAERFTSI
ncbi:Transcriptional regulator [Hahella chejuensis KCTC 2396]|uniref:Transcriptional regulator n=1 Tax=Hahella chejuensis (strain KCTC 2396) TaxID=349521 RepID=Q2SFL4_HAHCH|nr:LysR family transcriptional regulator [Hahella chejuensis]ABC30560.1 Transcriptional regulator [Hahella chejuensis KCTC 2396]